MRCLFQLFPTICLSAITVYKVQKTNFSFMVDMPTSVITRWQCIYLVWKNTLLIFQLMKLITCQLSWSPQTTHDKHLNFGPHLLSSVVVSTLGIDDINYKPLCCKNVTYYTNKNITCPQKVLLKWHSKLCIKSYHDQELMRDRHYVWHDQDEVLHLPHILQRKHATTHSCSVPLCIACSLSKQKLQPTGVKTS